MKELLIRYPQLEVCKNDIITGLELMKQTYNDGGKILLCGNGGSCADCEHIVGELMKGFMSKRIIIGDLADKIKNEYPGEGEYIVSHLQGALPAISLPSQTAVISAFANDVASDMVYAQLVFGYGKKEDLLIGITTSGNSKNVINALKVAKSLGMKTLAMTGETKGMADEICDVVIKAPASETYLVQEYHLPIYHWLCAKLEKLFFEENKQ